jgi:integrase
MMTALEGEGLSPRTVALARTVLRRALTVAERRGKVARNVAALTEPPAKSSTKLDDALDADEAAAVLRAARGDRLEALAVLVLATGLRQGEALRLQWSEVNLTAGTLRVIESKTPSGVRTIALPDLVVAALKTHRRRQRDERMASEVWGDPNLVFATTVGTQLDRRNVLRWWHGLTTRAGVGRRRFHASRHSAASLMLNAGVPLEVVSATLGHAGLAVTSDVYARVGEALQRQAASVMDAVLGQA